MTESTLTNLEKTFVSSMLWYWNECKEKDTKQYRDALLELWRRHSKPGYSQWKAYREVVMVLEGK